MPNAIQPLIPIFIGFNPRQRSAVNVLIDSLNQHSSKPVAITPLAKDQLEAQGFYWRECSTNQNTPFTFTRFLVPHLMNYQGWAILMDCDMLCRGAIDHPWAQGGPWLPDFREAGGHLAAEWHAFHRSAY